MSPAQTQLQAAVDEAIGYLNSKSREMATCVAFFAAVDAVEFGCFKGVPSNSPAQYSITDEDKSWLLELGGEHYFEYPSISYFTREYRCFFAALPSDTAAWIVLKIARRCVRATWGIE
jgi:hypothetical protein